MRWLALLLLSFALFSPRAEAGASATCPYYGVTSTGNTGCFNSRAEAEVFIRTPKADGSQPLRPFLVVDSIEPMNTVSGTYIVAKYKVKPMPAAVGAQAFKASWAGASSQYIACASDSSGGNVKCVKYGMSNGFCGTNGTPDLCIYKFYARTLGAVNQGIAAFYAAGTCPSSVGVAIETPWSSNPTSSSSTPPDESFPAGTKTFKYSGGKLRISGTDCKGNPVSSIFDLNVAAPVTCPSGWTFSPGSPPTASRACTSNETGEIHE